MQYVVRTSEIDRYMDVLKKSFLVYYPIKANSNYKLVDYLNKYVDGYEADSLYHVSMLIKKHKVSPEKIFYSYPLKTSRNIKNALDMGITNFVVDDILECKEIIKQAHSTINFIIRVDVSNCVKESNLFVKWGASLQEISLIKNEICNSIHRIKGFSFYLPQEINNYPNFEIIIKKLFLELDAGEYEVIDIGGGIADEILPKISSLLRKYISSTKTKVIIEQGQFLLNRAIDLQVKILDIRYQNENKIVYIDSGIYHGLLDVVLKKKKFKIVANKSTQLEKCLICGDSSDISDIIGMYYLPAKIKCGDKLLIVGCGAYCEELITPFSKRKKPTIRLT